MRRFLIIFCLFFVFSGYTLAATSARKSQTTYVVQPGDNLFRLSLRFNTTVAALAAANGITNVNLIFAGQTLIIPGPGGPVPTPIPGTPVPGRGGGTGPPRYCVTRWAGLSPETGISAIGG